MPAKKQRLLSNNLFRLLTINLAIGGSVAVMLVAGLMLTDAQGIGTLIRNTQSPVIAVVLLFGGFFITCASVAMGCAIMLLPRGDEDDDDRGGGLKSPLTPEPLLAVAQPRRLR